MKWLVVFVVIILAETATSKQLAGAPTATGSCASINYTRQCCPPSSSWSACEATDVQDNETACRCDSLCHLYHGECCKDNNCTDGKDSASVLMSRFMLCVYNYVIQFHCKFVYHGHTRCAIQFHRSPNMCRHWHHAMLHRPG